MRSATVLIVEDNEDIRDAIHELLAEEAYLVLEAEDGLAGLALLNMSQEHLVVLVDYQMPRMDGLAMLRAVAQDAHLLARHTFILLTANGDRLPDEFARLIAMLQIPVIGKPFELQDLVNAVARAYRALPEEDGGAPDEDAFGN